MTDLTPAIFSTDTHEPLRRERITGLDLIRCRCGGLYADTTDGIDRHLKEPA